MTVSVRYSASLFSARSALRLAGALAALALLLSLNTPATAQVGTGPSDSPTVFATSSDRDDSDSKSRIHALKANAAYFGTTLFLFGLASNKYHHGFSFHPTYSSHPHPISPPHGSTPTVNDSDAEQTFEKAPATTIPPGKSPVFPSTGVEENPLMPGVLPVPTFPSIGGKVPSGAAAPIPEPQGIVTGSLLGATTLFGMARGRRRKDTSKRLSTSRTV